MSYIKTSYFTVSPYFSPLTISNCALWMDGSDPFGTGAIPPNYSTIGSWIDKSSNAVAFSTSGAPMFSTSVYNKNGLVVFNGSTMLVNSSFLYNLSSRTLFVVAQQTAYNNNNCGILSFAKGTANDATSSGTISYNTGYDGTSEFQIISQFPGIFFNYIGSKKNMSFRLFSDTSTGGNLETAYVNGRQQYSKPYTISIPTTGQYSTGLTIGSRTNDRSRFFFGYIAEIVIYNYTLGNVQREQVEGYLAQKWGLNSLLPDPHLGQRIKYYNTNRNAYFFYTPYELGHVGRNNTAIYMTKRAYIYGPTNFYPTVFGSGLTLWLDAFDSSTIISSGNNIVTTWIDKSGKLNNAITQSPIGPTWIPWNNTLQDTSIKFNGNNYMQITNNFMSTLNGTMFVVFRAPTATFNQPQMVIQDQGAWSMNDFQLQTNNWVVSTNQSSIVSQFPSPITQYSITSIEIVNQLSTINTYLNGSLNQSVKFSSFYSTSDTLDLPNIGRYTSSGVEVQNVRFTGDLHEIIVYNSTLTTFMRQLVEGYLASKWYMYDTLPSGHPYYKDNLGPNCNSAYVPTYFFIDKIPTFPNLLTWFDFSQLSGTSTGNIPAIYSVPGTTYTFQGNALVTNSVLSNTINPTSNTTLDFHPGYSMTLQPQGQNYSSKFTIIVLYRQTGGNNNTLFQGDGSGPGTGYFYGYYGGGKQQWYENGWVAGDGGPIGRTANSDTQWDLDVFICDGNSGTTYRSWGSNFPCNCNGSQYAGLSLNIGYNWGQSDGQFQELFVFNSNINSAYYQALEGYLAWKYALQARLNSSHPFRYSSPIGGILCNTVPIIGNPDYVGGINPLSIVLPSNIQIFLQAKSWTGTGNWLDFSPNFRDAYLEYGIAQKNSSGNGVVLDGNTAWIFPNVGVGSQWTCEFWYYNVGGWNGLAQIVCQAYYGNNMAMDIGQWDTLGPSFYSGCVASAPYTPYTSFTTWTHFTATWDGTFITSYVNGVLYGQTQPGCTAYDGGTHYRIGRRWDDNQCVNGVIGELRIYDVPLTAAQVLIEYNNTLPLYPVGTT
jgi:hypothetical protein